MENMINIAYLVASVLFILGLKGLTSPKTAVRGNMLGALGMLLAVVATMVDKSILDYRLIAAGIAVGSAIGAFLAVKIAMTAMPQLVAIFNGFGGAASVLVGAAALVEASEKLLPGGLQAQFTVSVVASAIIGGITFTGSFIAFVKLQELFATGSVNYPMQKVINALLAIAIVVLAGMVVTQPPALPQFWVLIALSCVLGITLVLPIGGADMPVVIALLNSYSGIAASAAGFVLDNTVLIIAGSLVGASGIILTTIMCKAMNRSLVNVIFGTVGSGAAGSGPDADEVYAGKVKSAGPEEAAMILETARKVVIVPGYGLAVAQAQHAVRDLANLLKENGAEIAYGIHPVAGRMPGHMNVLLAEADIPYEELLDLDQVNQIFAQTDVAIVLGANDVVNPSAREDPSSPIAGLPILNVDQARTVLVVKRSLSPGFAGIPNPLFAADNALMCFGDGKAFINELIASFKDL